MSAQYAANGHGGKRRSCRLVGHDNIEVLLEGV